MKETVPSRTALRVALRRAAHQVLDSPKVLDDPFALRIVGDAASEILGNRGRHQTRTAGHFRAFMVARSRYAEDQLAASLDRGATQYLILGAGLDTSAYRNTTLKNVQVFEVDHPNTQAWKLERLQAAQIPVPGFVRFVSVDFAGQDLAAELRSAGFRTDQPTFVSWLGVVPYLTKEAAARTLGFLGKLPERSGVVFDYSVPRSSLGWIERIALDALTRRVARAGEPFRLFFTPEELNTVLVSWGFSPIEQLAAAEINSRYFANRQDGLRVGGNAGRLVSAWT